MTFRVHANACRLLAGLTLLFSVFQSRDLGAADKQPIAIQAMKAGYRIETMWGHRLEIGAGASQAAETDAKQSHAYQKPHQVTLQKEWGHTLSRLPNAEVAQWTEGKLSSKDPNAVYVASKPQDDGTFMLIDVDGVRIGLVYGYPKLDASVRNDSLDVLLLLEHSQPQADGGSWLKLLEELAPRELVLQKDSVFVEDLGKLKGAWAECETRELSHNTLAVSSLEYDERPKHRITVLSPTAWEMPGPLAEKFEAMEESCRRSQEVFAALTLEQLNFKPSNGTHTPRWNAEHMMGRQLIFFSQIYSQLDPAIQVMNLNPAQMPPDYLFAHPDWEGEEEARQMQRVSDFTRRFAYLLDGMQLAQRPPATPWPSLNALLRQMERHYDEHTGNTKKKFDLEDWPK